MNSQIEDIRVDFITGSRRVSNFCWALILSLGALGFSLVGFSSYLRKDLIFFLSAEQIMFVPQGLVMFFYGIAGLSISFYLWCTIWWNVGSGYNRFDKRNGTFSLFRWGFPGKNRRIFVQFLIRDIRSVRMEVREGFLPRRILYIRIKGQQDIPLSRIEEYSTLREMEDKAAGLARFSKISIEGI
uniref:photosystem I assembly protein Ycf4 n=1 Tax=Pellia neesiana TaxID=70144 RepID=UPI0025795CA0|nr:photosystem I assembly protein Ycf4 [Pellia neesiana]WIA68605.1 photosystem I assembly protein Ycf4 [Pellia neesiana]WIA68691.1 photosystem I assembly protein Ycf4 [Pellia neesiana]WIA68777.1 photosystem I assembly protein Ycf4 [Pellia neesiana]